MSAIPLSYGVRVQSRITVESGTLVGKGGNVSRTVPAHAVQAAS